MIETEIFDSSGGVLLPLPSKASDENQGLFLLKKRIPTNAIKQKNRSIIFNATVLYLNNK
ncbi:hypothetical protein CLV57_3441 [Mucilaginibacter auburnensis]|uniref:Uncharacterized protein n=1 Tax=Mucilaginibacter auburnensis TaxID=1457233 RepID=A0A2H9VPQ2_9SPHI|nr:hypothetical protein CLV57_3441 [Mucilaginibacter auburnensis]